MEEWVEEEEWELEREEVRTEEIGAKVDPGILLSLIWKGVIH